ncbi:hypothetical protein [Streptomyces zaomyceticus]|nr:hypothetical protein OG237_44055 [Streptomyces zaomyceticus]
MTRPGQKQNGFAGHRPHSPADDRPGNNACGSEDVSTTRKPKGPKAS